MFAARIKELADANIDALDHPMPRSSEQRRFDAIHAIFMASVTDAADGKRPEPLVNIIIDAATGLEVVARHGFLDLTTNDLTTNDLTSKARHAAQLLAVQCGFRGCDVPAEFCDVDHIEPWTHGSETNQANTPEPEPEPQPQPQPQRLRRHRRYTWDQWVTKHPKLTNLPVPPHGTTFRVISNLRPAA